MTSNKVHVEAEYCPIIVKEHRIEPVIRIKVVDIHLKLPKGVMSVKLKPRPTPKGRVLIPVKETRAPFKNQFIIYPLLGRKIIEIKKEILEEFNINPGEYIKAERILRKYLQNFREEVIGILAYIDDTTIDFLSWIPENVKVKILTSATGSKKNKIKRMLQRRKNISVIEITYLQNNRKSPFFHKRWLADKHVFLDLGTDLKKSSLAAKQHTIRVINAESQEIEFNIFYFYWEKPAEELRSLLNLELNKETIYSIT